ncbi:hypothetical protein ACP26L_08705 [Paenibacillus sp. S-38]|uniref:hypothetical protein n=1 Tax=Paenibacillus sp. S-38 TaxID=3416710 RepID=UPI003CF4F9C2
MTAASAAVPFLQQILAWEKKIAPDVPYLETATGLFLGIHANDNGGYSCSPADSVCFARTGVDGVHYCILTDFSTHTNLEEAPVICVAPMDFGHCVRLVAKNLRDFFSMTLAGQDLLLFNDITVKPAYLDAVRRQEEDRTTEYFDHREWKRQGEKVWRMAQEEFGLKPIPDPFDYMQEIRADRRGRVVLQTEDGLGVMPIGGGSSTACGPHPWSGGAFSYERLSEITAFLDTAGAETKLSLIRDYQAQAFSDCDSLLLLVKELERMGLPSEARRLLHCMNN